jgi:hypothetical protein
MGCEDGVDRMGLHPFAEERDEVCEAKDTVGVGANDHARVADLRDDRCRAHPVVERRAIRPRHFEHEVGAERRAREHGSRIAGRCAAVFGASAQPPWAVAGKALFRLAEGRGPAVAPMRNRGWPPGPSSVSVGHET